MAEEPYILLSLREDKAKKLTQVIGNDTAKQILNYLSDVKDSTETEISEKLGIPISTVHYNLSNLLDAKLVVIDEFHYSKKGKEVNHYKLVNKLIIIMPKEKEGIREILKKIIPVTLFIAVASFAINRFSHLFVKKTAGTFSIPMVEMANEAEDSAIKAASSVQEHIVRSTDIAASEPNIAFWFLLGGICVLLLYLIIDIILHRKKQ